MPRVEMGVEVAAWPILPHRKPGPGQDQEVVRMRQRAASRQLRVQRLDRFCGDRQAQAEASYQVHLEGSGAEGSVPLLLGEQDDVVRKERSRRRHAASTARALLGKSLLDD